uniref:Uncharacterized protein n=1 Tax=Octopus bimaculoides TaxID=37653 RepID=A0A0L8H7Z7_OCTBM
MRADMGWGLKLIVCSHMAEVGQGHTLFEINNISFSQSNCPSLYFGLLSICLFTYNFKGTMLPMCDKGNYVTLLNITP